MPSLPASVVANAKQNTGDGTKTWSGSGADSPGSVQEAAAQVSMNHLAAAVGVPARLLTPRHSRAASITF